MKRILTTATILLLVCISSAVNAQYNLIGKWVDMDSPDSSSFIFEKDSFVSMYTDGVFVDGHGHDIEGITASSKYTATMSGKMCKVNVYITLPALGNMVVMVAPGLIEFTDANTIKFAINMDHEEEGDLTPAMLEKLRPKDFSNPDNTITMKRVKK
jgi:hypothetical protein